jgi:hypothetical protein
MKVSGVCAVARQDGTAAIAQAITAAAATSHIKARDE